MGGIGNDKDEDKFETGFAEWLPSWVEEVQAPPDPRENDPPAPLFHLVQADPKDAVDIARPLRTRRLLVGFNKRISPPDYEYSIRHIQVLDPENTLPYLLGDALAVYWNNDETRTREFLAAYGLDAESCFTARALEGVASGVKGERLDGTFRIFSLFSDMLDIFGRPSKNFLKDLSKVAAPGPDKDRLKFLTSEEGASAYAEEITGESLTFADVLLKFSSVKPDLNQLITMLPVMKPRLYTIASSTRLTPGSIIDRDHQRLEEQQRRDKGGVVHRFLRAHGHGQEFGTDMDGLRHFAGLFRVWGAGNANGHDWHRNRSGSVPCLRQGSRLVHREERAGACGRDVALLRLP